MFAYQFDNSADYQAAVISFNKAEGFDPAKAAGQLPAQQGGRGQTVWYTTWHSKLYPTTAGQVLECFYGVASTRASDAPAHLCLDRSEENAFFQAVAGQAVSHEQLDTWWGNHGGPFTSDRRPVIAGEPEAQPAMPGGGVARRPLHFIIMADCSGSMTGERMQALNYAIADMLPQLADWERDQLVAQVLVRVLAFATVARWHVADPDPRSRELRWKPLQAVEGGYTNMAPAFREVAAAIGPDRLESRALRPAILLVTDGRPTDLGDEFADGLGALTSFPAGRASLRLAIAIGHEAPGPSSSTSSSATRRSR